MADDIHIDILICTYERESIKTCLQSVLDQIPPVGVNIGIIVADNATSPSAEQSVHDLARVAKIPIKYIHAPAQNISLARNACLDASHADWVVFIDDDEYAPSDWLRNLWRDVDGHDVVFGDVVAQYPANTAPWITQCDFHSTMIAPSNAPIDTGYAGNVIMRWAQTPWYRHRFDLALGKSGGEDTAFFNAVYRMGATLGVSRGGFVWEPVPNNRLSFQWLSRRRFRSGQSYGDIARHSRGAMQISIAAMAKVGISGLCTLATIWHPKLRGFWALRAVFHAGVLTRTIAATKPSIIQGRL